MPCAVCQFSELERGSKGGILPPFFRVFTRKIHPAALSRMNPPASRFPGCGRVSGDGIPGSAMRRSARCGSSAGPLAAGGLGGMPPSRPPRLRGGVTSRQRSITGYTYCIRGGFAAFSQVRAVFQWLHFVAPERPGGYICSTTHTCFVAPPHVAGGYICRILCRARFYPVFGTSSIDLREKSIHETPFSAAIPAAGSCCATGI